MSWLLSFFFSMMNLFSILTSFYSFSGMFMWLMMELNLVSFVGLSMSNMSKSTSLALLKYFSCQSLISIFFLFLFVGSAAFIIPDNYLNLFITMILFCKLGAAPFHMWFVSVMIKLDWFSFIWMFSFQKLIPLFFLFKLYTLWSMLLIFSTLSSLVHGLLVMKMKKALILSSVFSINWIYSSMIMSGYLWLMYFLVYTIIKAFMVMITVSDISKRASSTHLSLSSGLLIFSYFMFLAGVPPSPIFFLKITILSHLVSMDFLMVALILLTSSIILMFMYMNSVVFYCCQSVKLYWMLSFSENSYTANLFFHFMYFCLILYTLFLASISNYF
uniref:NADH-ubiquinone oxidoreductase chain 2 n=1 Tax=Paracyclopina nana TaxID=565004 RepID=C0J6S0_PARNA|nr:NADH dehydrogenase subunit 2 [Paracyclopina nana]